MYLSVTVSCWLHLKHKRTLVAFRYRMLKLHGWKVLSTITLLQGPPIYPRISLLTSHRGGGEGGGPQNFCQEMWIPRAVLCYISPGTVKGRQIWMELETSKKLGERKWGMRVSFYYLSPSPLPKGGWRLGGGGVPAAPAYVKTHSNALEGSEIKSSLWLVAMQFACCY